MHRYRQDQTDGERKERSQPRHDIQRSSAKKNTDEYKHGYRDYRPAGYKGKQLWFDTDSSEEDDTGRKGGMRSGINMKPNSNVREQMRYLHFSLRQISGYIGQNLQYHHLTFEQFIAGELYTINSVQSMEERIGRTELLQRITL